MIPKYQINLFWSGPDGAWVADVPDLRSCSAFGDTPAEALAEIEQAIEEWLAVTRKDGRRSRSPATARRPAPPAEAPRRRAETEAGRDALRRSAPSGTPVGNSDVVPCCVVSR